MSFGAVRAKARAAPFFVFLWHASRVRVGFGILAVTLTACAPSDTLFVPRPPLESGTLILAIDRADHEPRFTVQAIPIASAEDVIRPMETIEAGEDVSLEALVYAASLDELNLDPGPLPAVEDAPNRPLPEADATYTLALPSEAPSWTTTSGPSERLDTFRIFDPGPRDCVTFTAAPFSLGDETHAEMALVLSSTVVLIGQQSGRVQRWTPDGITPVTVSPAVTLSDGVRDPRTGGWWFITRSGWLFRGRIVGTTRIELESYSISSAVGELGGRHRIAVRYEGDEPTIYCTRSSGLVERFDENGSTILHRFDDGGFGAHTIQIPEGDIIAAASGNTSIVRIGLDGGVVQQQLPASAGFTAGAYVDGIGVVLGSSDGRFFAGRADGTWSEIGRSPLTVFPYAIAAFDEGFLYGAAFGAGGQYLPDGYCAVEEHLAAFSIQIVRPVEGGALLLGTNPNVPLTPGQYVGIGRSER